MIGKCGLVCTACEAYIATQADDRQTLTRMAEEANEQFNMTMSWEDSRCFGCLSEGKKIGYCDSCAVRICAVEKGVTNCAYCDDYGCETISKFWEAVPSAKITLDEIHQALN